MLFWQKLISSLIFLLTTNLIGGCKTDDNNPTTATCSEPKPAHDKSFHIETAGRLLISKGFGGAIL
jgi:hypothetical protein